MYKISFLLIASLFSIVLKGQNRCLKGNCQDGFGQFQWDNGARYVGNFKAGKLDGWGIYYWSDTYKYVGRWNNSKRTGSGRMHYPNGSILDGIWQDNQLVRIVRKNFRLSPAALNHGRYQWSRLLQSRPEVLHLAAPADSVVLWLQQQFAGMSLGSRIYWQDSASAHFPIPENVNAVHAYPSDIHEGKIWVANSGNAEKIWSGLVYELFNIRNAAAFRQIENEVRRGICSKNDYIRRFAQLEYKAAQATASFYEREWKLHCQKKGYSSNPQWWFGYLPDTFDAWMNTFTDQKGYPWHPYAAYYDKLVRSVIEKY